MRRRLLALVAATTSLVLIAFLVPLALLLRDAAEDRAVQVASTQVGFLTSLVATTPLADLRVNTETADIGSPSSLTVYLPDGTVLGTQAAPSPLVELARLAPTSATAETAGGLDVVVAVALPDGVAVVRAFVPDAVLTEGVAGSWLVLAGLAVGLLLVSLVVADRLGRRVVGATNDLQAVSDRLAAGDLTARAATDGPGELAVVAGALNGLAGRITDLLREERETLADLAHRVRTPLTALRLDAEALPTPDDATRIGDGVERVQHAVTEAIEQARRRSDTPDPTRAAAGCDAAAAVRERVAFWTVLAEDTDRAIRVDIAPGPIPVALARADLEAAVDALLGNVFAHTPDGTAFAVMLSPAAPGADLVVTDDGPGLPAAAVPARGRSGAGSTGLGMDIARRAAEQSGGQLLLGRSPAGGLAVHLRLGAPVRPGIGPR